ncbi:MAG: hypothetical protein HZB09_02235 [Candidatus Yonathbacteria bacterium]|nr:hypothetical protein [Candidatus Yonathbacteria bacterium]
MIINIIMWNYLKNLQNKPLHTRKMILYVSTIVLFSLIVLLWMLLLNIQKANESKTSSESILSPFDGIKETFTKMFEQIKTTNIPAIPQEINGGGAVNPLDINIATSTNGGMEMGTTTIENATGTPF